MKKILLVFLFSLCRLIVPAQFTPLSESAAFPEPGNGFGKIMQLKSGHTFYIHVSFKNGLDLKIFDTHNQPAGEKHIDLTYEDIEWGGVKAIFESNGDIVLLVNEQKDKVQLLYRIILDGRDGALKEDKIIAEVKVNKKDQGFRNGESGYHNDLFSVRKDPNSGHYAVLMYTQVGPPHGKDLEGFEVIYYSTQHQEISRASCSSPDPQFNHLQYLDMVVLGADKICLLTCAYSTTGLTVGDGNVYLMMLPANAKKVEAKKLSLLQTTKVTGAILRLNPFTQQFVVVSADKIDKKGTQRVLLSYLDPATQKVIRSFEPYPVHANEKCMALFGEKKPFSGIPQNIYFNRDNSFTLVYEEMTNYEGPSGFSELGNIAVLIFDKDGREGDSYFIPKKHFYFRMLDAFYPYDREGTAPYLWADDQFRSFTYINGKSKNYLLLNDVKENEANVQKGKMTAIRDVYSCDGFYYPLNGADILPARQFVFGKPAGRDQYNLGMFSISSYDQEKNLLVTLKLARDGRKKTASLVWLQPN